MGEEGEGGGSQISMLQGAYSGLVVKAPNGIAIYHVEHEGQV